MKKVPVVDDEPSILTLLTFNLEKEGYQVATSEDDKNGFELILSSQYDFIILDVILPGMDGLEVTKTLRREKIDAPISVLTAKSEQADKITGLEIGAGDYLAKLFSPREVLARMKAIFCRLEPTTIEALQEGIPKAPLVTGEIHVDEQNYEAFMRNQPIELAPKGFGLFVYFIRHKNRVINRETLLERIWQYDSVEQNRVVDVHISHLHGKIEPDPKRPVYLVTVRDFGYRFQEPRR